MTYDVVYDIECYPNFFCMTLVFADFPFAKLEFEISDWQHDQVRMMSFLRFLIEKKARMIGFNNVGYDYPVVHHIIRTPHIKPIQIYNRNMKIIGTDYENRWDNQIKPTECFLPQIDLYLINHFDNAAKATRLKDIQFNSMTDSLEDLPIEVGTVIEDHQRPILLSYCHHDTAETLNFYNECRSKVTFRDTLTARYGKDFTNFNDTKIGKEYVVMRLTEAGVPCYEYTSNGRQPKQTVRGAINLNDAILPFSFTNPKFEQVKEWLRQQTITETRGVFKKFIENVKFFQYGIEFTFGVGGLHASIKNKIIESDDQFVILDIDVKSYYPNTAIKNRFYPEHLGERFCDIVDDLYHQRTSVQEKMKTCDPSELHDLESLSGMLKLALNGVYGDSNNKFSVYYDPLYTMKTTLNGQLFMCKLIESVCTLEDSQLLQVNTDGITVRIKRVDESQFDALCHQWEQLTKLTLEKTEYKKMFIRDVNNYIAVKPNDKVKRKGAYAWEKDWHQDHSCLIAPKVASEVLLEGCDIKSTVENWANIDDFLIKSKVKRSDKQYLVAEALGIRQEIQGVSRFTVAHSPFSIVKELPPLKGKTELRQTNLVSGWNVCLCNDIKDVSHYPINYQYYIEEVEKLCLILG